LAGNGEGRESKQNLHHNDSDRKLNSSRMSVASPNGKSQVLKKMETKSIALILLQKNIDKSLTEKNLGKS